MTAERELLQADRQARIEALDITRSFIVQAPAGSGKTELLIQRYLRLLATVDNPEEILAITFTRKAAAEMRMRVVEALERAVSDDVPEQEHLQRTREAALDVLRQDDKQGWRLIANAQRMRIQTLDALNASIARMQPLTQSSGGVTSSVAEGGELDALYDAAALSTLDWLEEPNENGSAVESVLRHVDGYTKRYVDYLSRMLRTRDQWLPFIRSGLSNNQDTEKLRAVFENSLGRVVSSQLQELHASMPDDAAAEFLALGVYAAGNLLAEGKVDNPICVLAENPMPPVVEKVVSIESLKAQRDWWLGIAELLLIRTCNLRKQVNKNQGFPPGDEGQKDAMKALLADLSVNDNFVARLDAVRNLPLASYSDEQWAVLVALFRLLPIAVAELRRLYLARGITDHIEIALNAGEALGTADEPGDIALLMDYQIRHILVDEMQDTSKAQYRMLEALTGGWQPGDGRTLFVVGDPMQSIYRFRNAEVAQFLLAREDGIGAVQLEPLVLRQNFRSGSRLVDWFNRTFPIAMAASDDVINGAVAYSTAVSADSLQDQGECRIYPVFGGSVDDEATIGCQIIAATLSKTENESVAVLVRSRTHLPTLLGKLREANIPYQAVDIDRLSDLPEIIEVLALTRALSHAGDRVAWLALLRSPWVGLDWSDIHALVSDAPGSAVLELLQDPARRENLSADGGSAVMRFLVQIEPSLRLDCTSSLQQRVERAWFALGGPGLLTDDNAVSNVYSFFDTLSKFESGGAIADPATLVDRLDEERVSSSVASRVQIMTMHKAKGLQFDHVILYGLGRYPSANKKSVLSWLDLPDGRGGEEKIISPVGREDDLENDRLHMFIEQAQKAKDNFEKARVLYVACTRAKKALHLLGNVALSADGSEFKAPYKSSLLKLMWPVIEADYENAFANADVSAGSDEDNVFVDVPLRRFASVWQLPVVAEVPGGDDANDAAEAAAVNYEWVGIEARLAGTVTHRILQQMTQGRLDLSADSLAQLEPKMTRWLTELGASDAQRMPIFERIERAVSGVLGDSKGTWLLQGPGEAEFALTGLYDGRIQSIIIDRIRIDSDGSHWIVDYKTSSHEGGNMDGFLQAESERYRAQLGKYASLYAAYAKVPVKTALYFPLLQKFVEVRV